LSLFLSVPVALESLTLISLEEKIDTHSFLTSMLALVATHAKMKKCCGLLEARKGEAKQKRRSKPFFGSLFNSLFFCLLRREVDKQLFFFSPDSFQVDPS